LNINFPPFRFIVVCKFMFTVSWVSRVVWFCHAHTDKNYRKILRKRRIFSKQFMCWIRCTWQKFINSAESRRYIKVRLPDEYIMWFNWRIYWSPVQVYWEESWESFETILYFSQNYSLILRKKWEHFGKNTKLSRGFHMIFPSV